MSANPALVRLLERERVVSERIIEAFRAIAREDFVPADARVQAETDRPVGLPRGQTTSQPSLIARMIDAADVGAEDRVLEIGTGYGFQTALLAHIASEVVSVERWPELAAQARANLERTGVASNVRVVTGDGWLGWAEAAPYDAIIVSAAASALPPALSEQLRPGGRLVIPLAHRGSDDVYLFRKTGEDLERVRLITPARFVPLVPGRPEA